MAIQPTSKEINPDKDVGGFRIHEDDLGSFREWVEELICQHCLGLLDDNLNYKSSCPPECDPSKVAEAVRGKIAGVAQVESRK